MNGLPGHVVALAGMVGLIVLLLVASAIHAVLVLLSDDVAMGVLFRG